MSRNKEKKAAINRLAEKMRAKRNTMKHIHHNRFSCAITKHKLLSGEEKTHERLRYFIFKSLTMIILVREFYEDFYIR